MIHCPECKTVRLWTIDHESMYMRWRGPKDSWPQYDRTLNVQFECENGHRFWRELNVTDEEPQSRQTRTISLKIDAPTPVQYPTPLRSIPESWLERVFRRCCHWCLDNLSPMAVHSRGGEMTLHNKSIRVPTDHVPTLRKAFDDNLEYPYILDVDDTGYCYHDKKERDEDFKTLKRYYK